MQEINMIPNSAVPGPAPELTEWRVHSIKSYDLATGTTVLETFPTNTSHHSAQKNH